MWQQKIATENKKGPFYSNSHKSPVNNVEVLESCDR